MWSTAVLRAYLFVSSLTVIMYFYFLQRDAQPFRIAPTRFNLSSAKPHVMNSDVLVSTLPSKNHRPSRNWLCVCQFRKLSRDDHDAVAAPVKLHFDNVPTPCGFVKF